MIDHNTLCRSALAPFAEDAIFDRGGMVGTATVALEILSADPQVAGTRHRGGNPVLRIAPADYDASLMGPGARVRLSRGTFRVQGEPDDSGGACFKLWLIRETG